MNTSEPKLTGLESSVYDTSQDSTTHDEILSNVRCEPSRRSTRRTITFRATVGVSGITRVVVPHGFRSRFAAKCGVD